MVAVVGIEKIRAYPASLMLPMRALCEARGRDPDELRTSMMVDERSLNPPWEDPVTMAVNAARPMLTARHRAEIGLVIVASESAGDAQKPITAWVQRYLGLSPRVRTIDVKHAGYGATAALQLAASWVASNSSPGECALVISTDQSRPQLGQPSEYALGAASVAMLVSARPRVLEIELGASGLFAKEVTGNSEHDYLQGLEGAFDDYVRRIPAANDLEHFARMIYHLPFASMGLVAHRAVLRRYTRRDAADDFANRCGASLANAKRIGGSSGASTFLALMAMISNDERLAVGDRIGVFAYGSGSGEMWSGKVMPEAREVVHAAGLPALLDRRREVTVAEYEAVERARERSIEASDHTTDRTLLGDWFERYYTTAPHLIFDGTKDDYRYSWSIS